MVEQLSIFDMGFDEAPITTIMNAINDEEPMNEEPINEVPIAEAAKQKAVEPTFLIAYYDEEQREKLTWIRAANEDRAILAFKKEFRRCLFKSIEKSDRDYDELEALD